jgi:hypothetical protein
MPRETTAPKPFCFVLMPFTSEFNDIYQFGIKDVCKAAGAYSERVDEQFYQGSTVDRIYNQISKADFIIADMTGQNPNVFYEVGYANALGKQTILLTKDVGDIPFDLKNIPHVVYESIADLKDKLKPRVKWCIENPDTTDSPQEIDIEVFNRAEILSAGHVQIYVRSPRGTSFSVRFTVVNQGTRILKSGDVRAGFIVSKRWESFRYYDEMQTATLQNEDYLCMMPPFGDLFPGAAVPLDFQATCPESNEISHEEEERCRVRIFTASGFRDYPFIVRRE